MAKTTIDLNDYQPPEWEEYTGDDPRPGWYTFSLQDVGWFGEDKDTLRWIFTLEEEPYKGWGGFLWSDLGERKWLAQQAVIAIQGDKPLVCDFDNDKDVAALVKRARKVRGQVRLRTNRDSGEVRTVLYKVRPLAEEAGASKARTGRAKAEDLTPAEPVEAAAAEEGNDEPYTQEELDEMSIDDLKAILGEDLAQEVPAKGRRESDEDYGTKLADLILAAQEAEEGGENGDDFGDGDAAFQEPVVEEPPVESAPTRRRRGAAAAAPAPAKKAAAPAATTRRRRG